MSCKSINQNKQYNTIELSWTPTLGDTYRKSYDISAIVTFRKEILKNWEASCQWDEGLHVCRCAHLSLASSVSSVINSQSPRPLFPDVSFSSWIQLADIPPHQDPRLNWVPKWIRHLCSAPISFSLTEAPVTADSPLIGRGKLRSSTLLSKMPQTRSCGGH